jgi:hypothetical protein
VSSFTESGMEFMQPLTGIFCIQNVYIFYCSLLSFASVPLCLCHVFSGEVSQLTSRSNLQIFCAGIIYIAAMMSEITSVFEHIIVNADFLLWEAGFETTNIECVLWNFTRSVLISVTVRDCYNNFLTSSYNDFPLPSV